MAQVHASYPSWFPQQGKLRQTILRVTVALAPKHLNLPACPETRVHCWYISLHSGIPHRWVRYWFDPFDNPQPLGGRLLDFMQLRPQVWLCIWGGEHRFFWVGCCRGVWKLWIHAKNQLIEVRAHFVGGKVLNNALPTWRLAQEDSWRQLSHESAHVRH